MFYDFLFHFNYQSFIPGVIPDLPESRIGFDSFSGTKTVAHGAESASTDSFVLPDPASALARL